MKRLALIAVMAAAVSSSFLLTAQDAGSIRDRLTPLYSLDPWIGTWKLNVEKSGFDPGPTLKSGTAKIQTYGDGIKCTFDPLSADGQVRYAQWTALYDGKEYRVIASAVKPFAGSVTLKRIDSHTLTVVYMRDGKQILSEKWIVSGNHSELRISQFQKNPAGKDLSNILVFEKEYK